MMVMTDSEIARSYREAKVKKAQIGILADLNCMTKEQIKEILKRQGIVLPGGSTSKAAKETHKVDAPVEIPTEVLTDPSAEKVAVEIKVEEPKAPQAVIDAAKGLCAALDEQIHGLSLQKDEITAWLKEVEA